jgi:hypothetical protein
MAKKPSGPQTRERAARSSATVKSVQEHVESVYGLPKGSVQIVDPATGKNIRDDAKVKNVRKRGE